MGICLWGGPAAWALPVVARPGPFPGLQPGPGLLCPVFCHVHTPSGGQFFLHIPWLGGELAVPGEALRMVCAGLCAESETCIQKCVHDKFGKFQSEHTPLMNQQFDQEALVLLPATGPPPTLCPGSCPRAAGCVFVPGVSVGGEPRGLLSGFFHFTLFVRFVLVAARGSPLFLLIAFSTWSRGL